MKNLRSSVQVNRASRLLISIFTLLYFIFPANATFADNVIVGGTTLKVMAGTTLTSTESLTIKSGATLDNSGTVILKKNLANENIAANSLGSGIIEFSGTTSQSLNGKNIIQNLTLNNSTGLTNGGDNRVNGILTLTSGQFNLGSNNLTLGSDATFAGTPSVSAMLVPTGSGEVRKTVSGTGSFTLPVGDNTTTSEYSPITLNFTAGTFGSGNYVGINLVNAQYPGSPSTGNFLKRYWNLSQSGITSFTCNATLQYVPADVNGTESQIYCVRVTPSVAYYNIANTTLHQLTATGLTTLGTFTGFQTLTDKSLSLTVLLEGLYNGSGTMRKAQNSSGDQFSGPTADQVSIELRNSASYSSLAFTASSVNLSTAGVCTASVPGILSGSYYVTIRHRNSVTTTTAAPVSFTGSSISYNFTNLASKAFGSNMKSVAGGYWVFYGGDANQDGLVDSVDLTLLGTSANLYSTGYVPEDINGDGVVDTSDIIMADNNSKDFITSVTP
jgi:hypothetical protein